MKLVPVGDGHGYINIDQIVEMKLLLEKGRSESRFGRVRLTDSVWLDLDEDKWNEILNEVRNG